MAIVSRSSVEKAASVKKVPSVPSNTYNISLHIIQSIVYRKTMMNWDASWGQIREAR
jgi:hypothetical protein